MPGRGAYRVASLLLIAACTRAAFSQQRQSNTQTPPSAYPPYAQGANRFPGDLSPDEDPARENSRQRAREKERQKRIVDDANRLVQLTAQYRTAVEQHGSVTADDQKLLMQIERLAREVKDRMRGM